MVSWGSMVDVDFDMVKLMVLGSDTIKSFAQWKMREVVFFLLTI